MFVIFVKYARIAVMKLFNNPDHKVCKRCGTQLDRRVTRCPNCDHGGPSWLALTLICALILTPTIAYMIIVYNYAKTFQEQKQHKENINMAKNATENSQGVNIRIKPMVPLSGLSADEILEIRKDAVKDAISLGDVSKYEPSEQVFSIEDGLPWIGAYEVSCNGSDNNKNIGEGESRESVGILNPELLYYFIIPSYNNEDSSLCSAADYMVPRRLTYWGDKNILAAYIDYRSLLKMRYHQHRVFPSDANARDFGYNWAYADKFDNIRFESENNFSKQITQTMGYWHRGYACGLQGGCNNYSPRNTATEFVVVKAPASINIKLWKNEPRNPRQKADMNYMIVFE